ncbi:hypothetical protein SPRG_11437 [Saprolegnia parasitica CBS 223.65]|uniref:Fibronectin type-III domain-containing protein n=1 Tax=Saprolegnia parasitica (strain CBS 223.65) TaxID=695850 RepID=A0A067C300_SAPPC|nr:hypothetical protein SPRG_11437 [Saprolegnia parasitica CBS 223.65]KDO23515.1 hypothetical protein SPRG_11437 [Saprolegnia parasitica CBS 223.65]|eukprot:XP_012205828.1 hypothetical protein SPRG_11437 [Saprolegnia parasitica CBS 223.65]
MTYKSTSTTDPEDEGNEPWRVTLLRALIHGDLEIMTRDLTSHVHAIAQKLTTHMSRAKLEWETLHWWQLQDATPLFIASLFAHPPLVRWLLKRGADRNIPCYLGQTALDLCGEHSDDADAIDQCSRLLKNSPKIPNAPERTEATCHISTEQVFRHIQVAEENEKGVLRLVDKRVPHTLHKCILNLRWATPLSNGSMIEKYEVRYRVHVPGEKSMVRGWRSQTTTHSRLRDTQTITIEGLQLETCFDVSVRAQNAVGRGDWSTIELVTAPSHPKD